jgi:hypothetical protein
MATITLDVAYAEAYETLADSLAALTAAAPTVSYRIDAVAGPAGGWPLVTIVYATREDALAIIDWYGDNEDDELYRELMEGL